MEENKPEEKVEEKETEKNIGMAVVAYFLFFVPLLTDSKDDPFVKFHVKQSLVIFCLSLAFYLIRFFFYLGRFFYLLYPFISLAILALFIIGIINAINGNKKELPVVGKFAEKWFKF